MDLSAVMNVDEPSAAAAQLPLEDDEDAYRRKFEELQRLKLAAEQEREQLSARYAVLTARLGRIQTENEYLVNELSYYEPSDFESDQSDIELATTRPMAAARARRPAAKLKAATKSKAKEKDASGAASSATKRKRAAPATSKPKKTAVKKVAVEPEE